MATATSSFKVESGIQLLARLTKKQGIENFYPAFFPSGPKHGDTIEFLSNENLTPVIIDVACTALLPTCLNGHETGVLILNSNGHINYNNLMSSLQEKIIFNYNTQCDISAVQSKEKIDNLLQKALNNLFIIEIYDATQFYATIFNLENIFMEHPNITMLLIDTITAFYWSEQTFKITKMDTYLNKILNKIQKVTKEHKVIIIYTRPEYFCSSKESLEPCCENPTPERVNYRIHITHNNGGIYQANIKSYTMRSVKQFRKEKNQIIWI